MKIANWVLLALLVLASFLRLYHLDMNPPAAYGDEISFAWNAWSILKTGQDEWGVSYPLQFRAFDDYKAPVPVYLLVPIFAIFGMNTLTVRLPVAIISIATIWLTYLLVKEMLSAQVGLLNAKAKHTQLLIQWLPVITSLLLTISPWHIHLSRGYFEATIALFLFLLGIYFWLKAFSNPLFFYASSISFALALYTYFSPRLMLLIYLPFIFMFFRKKIKLQVRSILVSAIILFISLSLPLVKLAIFDKGGNRLQYFINQRLEKAVDEATREIWVAGGPLPIRKSLHNRYVVVGRNILNDYLEHLSLNFWYIYGDNSLRYFLGKMGMFYLFELPFLGIGLFFLLKNHPRLAFFVLGWLLIAPIPAALVGRSFAVRSLSMLPAPFIFVGSGIIILIYSVSAVYRKWLKPVVLMVILGFLISWLTYFLRYHLDYIRYAATWWGWENKAAIEYARLREKDYDHIFLSDFYRGMPQALVFYHLQDPKMYREALKNPVVMADGKVFLKFGKYYIGSFDLDEKRLQENFVPPNSLYIGRPEEIDGIDKILAPDDARILFKIHQT